ncbi:MAG: PTS sugar transporter subunit IIA [Erysipelotrichaceae bacterium]
MKGILLVSHGFYAEELKKSLKMIAGNVDNICTACLEETDGPDQFTEKIKTLEAKLNNYQEVIVFSDLLGGSPGNTALQYLITKNNYSFIAGMNFPMVLTSLLESNSSIENIIQAGKDGIVDVRAFMTNMSSDDEE